MNLGDNKRNVDLEATAECHGRFWSVGSPSWPPLLGIRFYSSDSSSFSLAYPLVEYIARSRHVYLDELKSFHANIMSPLKVGVFKHGMGVLVPNNKLIFFSQSFIPTAVLNSPYCNELIVNSTFAIDPESFVDYRQLEVS